MITRWSTLRHRRLVLGRSAGDGMGVEPNSESGRAWLPNREYTVRKMVIVLIHHPDTT